MTTMSDANNDDDDVVTQITHNVVVVSDIAKGLLHSSERDRSFSLI